MTVPPIGDLNVPLFPATYQPKVSVIIPSHRPQLLQHAIGSYIAQTLPKEQRECIVKLCEAEQYWGEKVNEAARAAVGKYYLVLCDDDKLAPTMLEKMVAKAEEGFDVVLSNAVAFGESTHNLMLPPWTRETFYDVNPAWISSLVSAELWHDIGGYDPAQEYQDKAFWYECYVRSPRVAKIHEPLLQYRIHPDSGSRSMNHDRANQLIWKKYPELAPV